MNLLFLLPSLLPLPPPHPPSLPPQIHFHLDVDDMFEDITNSITFCSSFFLFPLSHRHLRLHTIQRLLPQIRFPLDVGGDVFGDIRYDPSQAVAREEDNVFKHDHEHDSGQHHLIPNRSRLVGGGRVRSVVAVVTYVVANKLWKMRDEKGLESK